MSHPSSRAAVTARPIVLAAALCGPSRAAQGLGGTRQALSEPVNERTRISVEMAIRLSKAFGSTPGTWLGMQDGLRPLAGPRPRRGDRGGTFCVGGELEPSRDDME